jgi:hypothetical protein
MKRSGDVTAAAVILFCGSGLCLLLAFPVTLASLAAAQSGGSPASAYAVLAVLFGAAIWGISTGVGLLKLQRWAWISTIVMSGTAIFVSFFGTLVLAYLPSLNEDPGLNAAAVRLVLFGGMAMFVAAMAISGWWLVLFTRERVRLQFAIGGLAGQDGAPAPQIPVSIRVIAILSLAEEAFLLFSLQSIVRRHLPLVVFGVFTSGRPLFAYGAALVAAQIVFPIFVLRKHAWALEGMVWYAIANLLNASLFLASHARNRYFQAVSQHDAISFGTSAQAQYHRVRAVSYGGQLFAICIGVFCLYFLLTRRKAFRAACSVPVQAEGSQ